MSKDKEDYILCEIEKRKKILTMVESHMKELEALCAECNIMYEHAHLWNLHTLKHNVTDDLNRFRISLAQERGE